MTAYYNEWEPYPAQWLRNLIAANLIAPGDVDERSITDVKADDLKGYAQCHFFAGIGGWSVALRDAGWADDRPVWTGSCPCQDYSSSGKRLRQRGSRHLWPYWSRLIGESKPPTIFGEQVTGAIAAGWADEVGHDLEAQGYAFAATVLPACAVGSPQERKRFWFVADADRAWQSQQAGRIEKSRDGIIDRRKVMADSEGFGVGAGLCPRLKAEIGRGRFAHGSFEDRWSWAVEPNVGRLAHGVSGRVVLERTEGQSQAKISHSYSRSGALTGFGNAIVPRAGREVIEAFMAVRP